MNTIVLPRAWQQQPGGGSSGQYLIDHHMLDKAWWVVKPTDFRCADFRFHCRLLQVSFTGSGTAGQKMLEALTRRPSLIDLYLIPFTKVGSLSPQGSSFVSMQASASKLRPTCLVHSSVTMATPRSRASMLFILNSCRESFLPAENQ